MAEGAWQGPVEIISGTWGANNDQFGIEYGDTNDVFGGPFYILFNESIMLTDLMNGRMKTYSSTGALTKVTKCVKGPSGEWNEECRIPLVNYIQTASDGNIWVGPLEYLKQQGYSLYIPTGQLIKTSTTRPLELGVVSEQYMGPGQYKITVKFPDKDWSIIGKGAVPKYTRDVNGNLYGSGAKQAIRYSYCGKELARLTMPKANIQEVSRGEQLDPKINVLEEYGSPVIASNGDVYTWKRTPTNYSILKWTWVNDPNAPTGPDAPTGLTLMPSTTGIYLTWTASPSDPGCVTGYEVARASSSGGIYSTLATVDKGIIKYNDTTAAAGTTYYYKIRAVAGTEFSPYTAEVSGKR